LGSAYSQVEKELQLINGGQEMAVQELRSMEGEHRKSLEDVQSRMKVVEESLTKRNEK